MKGALAILIAIGLLASAAQAAPVDAARWQTTAAVPPLISAATPAPASQPTDGVSTGAVSPDGAAAELGKMLGNKGGGGSTLMQWIVLVTVLAVAPAILVLITCFTRIIVVLGLLRQALATQNLPPNQVLFGLALFMTLVVMAPVYQAMHTDAIGPYLAGKLDGPAAMTRAERHARDFMIRQIDAGRNWDDVRLFMPKQQAAGKDLTWGDVPTLSLIPAFVVSELKIAFAMGFKIYLPFLIIDMLVSSVLISMGMLMMPPVLISLPFKLLLFVLADGWHLVVGNLIQSFG